MKKTLPILLILLILLTGGYFSYQYWQDHTSSPTTNTTPISPTDPSEGGKYLVIREWGVRFPLPTNLIGQVTHHTDGPTTIFAVTRLTDSPSSNCGFRTDNNKVTGGIGLTLFRSMGQKPDPSPAWSNVLQAGNDWYTTTMPKGGCVENPADAQTEVDIDLSLNEAIKKLEVIRQ